MIPLPLSPLSSALLIRQIVLRRLGGRGSGNFGHSGRPGEKGGSASSEEGQVFYHGTSSKNAESISKEGLKPGSYLTTSPFYAKFYGSQDLRGDTFALLKVSVPKGHKLTHTYGEFYRSEDPLHAKHVSRSLGGHGSGNFAHSGRKGEVGGSGEGGASQIDKVRNARSLRALKAFIPVHAGAQRHAERNELFVRGMVGGTRTNDNLPVDVITRIGGRVKGIEVKTMINNSNDKITMRSDAIARKDKWGAQNHASVHTVVIDDRGRLGNRGYSGHRLYYAKGSGSFRLSGMTRVKDAAHLKELLAK